MKALAALIVLVPQGAPDAAHVKNREVALIRAAEIFGPRVQLADLALFEVDPFHALQLTFGKDGHIEAAVIGRKDRWDRAEWRSLELSHQYLSSADVTALVGKLDRLRSLGKLIRYDDELWKIVTNSTAHYIDVYQNGIVTRGQLAGVHAPEPPAPPRFRWLQARYSRLDPRIGPANPTTYRGVRDAKDWLNPFVVICSRPELIVRSLGLRKELLWQDMRVTLTELPLEAWPYGRIVALSECSIAAPGDPGLPPLHRRLSEQYMEDLGLRVTWWPH
jgi:hypothetical protein